MHVGPLVKLKFKAKTLKAAACLPPKIQLEFDSSYEQNTQLADNLSVFWIYFVCRFLCW